MEDKIRHLEMIQRNITRLADNSFRIKGWSVLLVTGLFALASKDLDVRFTIVALFPAIAFWILDGFFLSNERCFRDLYDQIRGMEEEDIDFSMEISGFKVGDRNWLRATFTKTLNVFHGMVIGVIILAIIITWFSDC